jgi:mRNA interferase MazF
LRSCARREIDPLSRRSTNPLRQERKEQKDHFDAFDIVVVPFPYADRLAEKRRPALVISNRRLSPLGLIWVAMITSAENAPWSCDVTIANLTRAGLPAPSVVRTAKIACIEPARIERRAGRLDKVTAKAVAQKLKGFLGSA